MKSLQRRFIAVSKKKYNWSNYLCFAEAVKGQSFSKGTIRKWLKLVEKDDYDKNDKRKLLANLYNLTNLPEAV